MEKKKGTQRRQPNKDQSDGRNSWIDLIDRAFGSAEDLLRSKDAPGEGEAMRERADTLKRMPEGRKMIRDFLSAPDPDEASYASAFSGVDDTVYRFRPFEKENLVVSKPQREEILKVRSNHAIIGPTVANLPKSPENAVTVVEVGLFDTLPSSAEKMIGFREELVYGRATVEERRSAASAARVREDIRESLGVMDRFWTTRFDVSVNRGWVGEDGFPTSSRLVGVQLQEMLDGRVTREVVFHKPEETGMPAKISWEDISYKEGKFAGLDVMLNRVSDAIQKRSGGCK